MPQPSVPCLQRTAQTDGLVDAERMTDHTLQPTVLVHEVFIGLVDEGTSGYWNPAGTFRESSIR